MQDKDSKEYLNGSFHNKKLILLDLDNTLICAEDLASVKEDDSKIVKAREKLRTVRMEDYYDIFERPHLQDFLDYLFENFNVGIWTASSKDYAIFVVKNFITQPENKVRLDRKIQLFLCSHHCNVSKKHFKGVPKDLKLLSDRWNLNALKDIILIDDLEHLAEHQPENVILIKPFFYDKEEAYTDSELLKVKETLKKYV
jgi:TFIIF-interacting CTD phosphatase-like protein